MSPVFAADPPGDAQPVAADGKETKGLKGFFRSLFQGGDADAPADSEGAAPAEEKASRASKAPQSAPDAKKAPPAEVTVPDGERPNNDSRADKFVTVEEGVKFYRDGPLQIRPADRVLVKGAIVQLVMERRGWSDVILESGAFGTVATETLRKAKVSDLPVEELVVVEDADAALGYASRGGTLDDIAIIPLADPELPDAEDSEGLEQFASPLLLPPLPE